MSDVRIIGEATNQSGPPLWDDYFFCFATGPGLWLEASFYAHGRDEFLCALATKLGSPLEPGLCYSADFASRILWPPTLAGEPMFRFDPITPKGLLGRLLGASRNRQMYTERVAAVLAREV